MRLLALVVSMLSVTPALVDAQRGFDLQLYLPPAGQTLAVSIEDPALPRHGSLVLGVSSSWAHQVLRRQQRAVFLDLVQLEGSLAAGLFEVLELGLVVPLVFGRVADDLDDPTRVLTSVSSGDIRISIQTPLLRGDFAMAMLLVTSLPTGDSDNLMGSSSWTTTPALVVSTDLGLVVLAARLGYRLRRREAIRDLEHDEELDLASGLELKLGSAWTLLAELRARLGVGGRSFGAAENPIETAVGARWSPAKSWAISLGVGTGLGDVGYGSPAFRLLGAIRYASEREPCLDGPEDYDGYRDGDYCADLDNDADSVPDRLDACPNDAEDRDGFADSDGCPDPDNDADGVDDVDDACPDRSEDRDGFEDWDGCPEADNDGDGVADGVDDCPMDPEDKDGFEDADGCPEPGPQRATVTVTDTRILISDRIYFEFDKDTIRSVSTPLLDDVAQAIVELAAQLRIRVDGHSDDAGSPEYNTDLSYRRAGAVVSYLKSRGVAAQRLRYRGLGASEPVAPNDSPEGRALNRRVEFAIEK